MSKNLEETEKFLNKHCLQRCNHNSNESCICKVAICLKEIEKAQEQEKVLSIIIKKNVSVWGFRNRVFGYQKEQNGNKIINDTYEYYLYHFGCYHNGFDIELLTEEEFNTLKEYFK